MYKVLYMEHDETASRDGVYKVLSKAQASTDGVQNSIHSLVYKVLSKAQIIKYETYCLYRPIIRHWRRPSVLGRTCSHVFPY